MSAEVSLSTERLLALGAYNPFFLCTMRRLALNKVLALLIDCTDVYGCRPFRTSGGGITVAMEDFTMSRVFARHRIEEVPLQCRDA